MPNKVLAEAEDKMKKAITVLKNEFATVRTGRASVSLLDRVTVDYFGTPTSLKQLATITAPEPRLLVVQPWDKSTIPNVEKAILQSDLSLTPSNDGTIIRLPIPALTEERRKELVKVARGLAEEAKISIRNIRREANETHKAMEKKHEISEDDRYRLEEQVQKLTDKHIGEIDEMLKVKEKEITEV